jgi:ATP-dependent protease ClpP protease subunit
MRALLLLVVLAVPAPVHAWGVRSSELSIRIDGGIDDETVKAVRAAASNSDLRTLRIGITSPGGSALAGLDAARILRQLSDKGVTVEIRASGLCASACTWILAAGTPGHRYIDRYTLFLVHPLQKGGGFGPPTCIQRDEGAKAIEQRTLNAVIEIARDLYVLFTGQAKETVDEWLTCGKELVGDGRLAVELKIADKVET